MNLIIKFNFFWYISSNVIRIEVYVDYAWPHSKLYLHIINADNWSWFVNKIMWCIFEFENSNNASKSSACMYLAKTNMKLNWNNNYVFSNVYTYLPGGLCRFLFFQWWSLLRLDYSWSQLTPLPRCPLNKYEKVDILSCLHVDRCWNMTGFINKR